MYFIFSPAGGSVVRCFTVEATFSFMNRWVFLWFKYPIYLFMYLFACACKHVWIYLLIFEYFVKAKIFLLCRRSKPNLDTKHNKIQIMFVFFNSAHKVKINVKFKFPWYVNITRNNEVEVCSYILRWLCFNSLSFIMNENSNICCHVFSFCFFC